MHLKVFDPAPAVPGPPLTLEQIGLSVERLALLLTLRLIDTGRQCGEFATVDEVRKFLTWWVKIGGPALQAVANDPGVAAELDRRTCDLFNGYFHHRPAVERMAKKARTGKGATG